MWREGNTYYLLGSHLTGWSANPAILSKAPAPFLANGTVWTELGDPSAGTDRGGITFNSQSTYVLPYAHPDGRQLLVYLGDRWGAGCGA